MKKNQKIIAGVGIAILLYLLWKKSKNKSVKPQPVNEIVDDTTTTTETKIDTSDIPTKCLSGFELNGKKYFIKDNKFQTE
jgi:hypothetical protein